MSREAASYSMTWTRGATAEEEFDYTDSSGVPVDLTGYSARMQIRTLAGQYGTSTTTTLLLELTTDNGMLFWDTADVGKLRLKVGEDDTTVLNPSNAKKLKLAYSIELFKPETSPATGNYVIPLIGGKITVLGETTR